MQGHNGLSRNIHGLPDERVFPNLSEEKPQDSTGYFATVIVKE